MTSPVSPRKRSLETAPMSGRTAAITVAYDSSNEITTVSASACRMSRSVVNSSGPMPCCHHSEPSASQTSVGPGKVFHGDSTQTSRASPAQPRVSASMIGADTARLGRNAAATRLGATGFMGSVGRRGPEHDLDAPVLGAAVGGGVRLQRLRRPVREDLDAPGREVRRRLLLEPLLDREGAVLRELHVLVDAALVVGVAVDLDQRAAGDEEVVQEQLELLRRRRRELGAAGLELDVPRA